MHEPIPDYNDAVSHLRVLRNQQLLLNINPISFPTRTDLTRIDFSRCVFKIVGNEVIFFLLLFN